MGTRLYVGNLSYETNEQELHDLFTQVGPVTSVALPTDRETGRVRGFAFVEMASEADAQTAIQRLNGSLLRERQINVNEAYAREERGGGGRGSSGRRSSSGYGGGRGGRGGGRSGGRRDYSRY